MWLPFVVFLQISFSEAITKNLAFTPPMGWIQWNKNRCNVNCEDDPYHCISERLYIEMAELIVDENYMNSGYKYIIIDGCWLEKRRNFMGALQADRQRFNLGIKYLADYIHSKGLKLGISIDFGSQYCSGFPGVINHVDIDAMTFIEWGIDYLMLDGCNASPNTMNKIFLQMREYLNQSNRTMILSCIWPKYLIYSGLSPNYSVISQTCNTWKNFDDIDDTWLSLDFLISQAAKYQEILVRYAKNGHWNDLDKLLIGNLGLTYEQSKVQMGMWAILAAPLIISTDLRSIEQKYKKILQNKHIIAVNQDSLGIQGKRIFEDQGIEVWTRPINPFFHEYYSYAIAFLNLQVKNISLDITIKLQNIGLTFSGGYRLHDLYEDQDYGIFLPERRFKVRINSTGIVMLKATIESKAPIF